MNLTLKWGGLFDRSDKEAYVVAEQNDGWHELRITLDIDDCDKDSAREMMQVVIDRCNAANKPE